MKKFSFFIFFSFLISCNVNAVDNPEKESDWRKSLQFSKRDRIFSEKHDGWGINSIRNIDVLILGGGRYHHFAWPYEGIRYSNFSMRGKACLAIEKLLNFYDKNWSSQAISIYSSNDKSILLFDKNSDHFKKKLQELIDNRSNVTISPQRGWANVWPAHADKTVHNFFTEIRKDSYHIIHDMIFRCLERENKEENTIFQKQTKNLLHTDDTLFKKLQDFEKQFYEDIHALFVVYGVAHAIMKNALQTFGPESLALRNGNEFYIMVEGNKKSIGKVGDGNGPKNVEVRLKQPFEEEVKLVLKKLNVNYNQPCQEFFKELDNKHKIEEKLHLIEKQLHDLTINKGTTFKKNQETETLEELLLAHSKILEKLVDIQEVFFNLKEISPLILACRLAAFFDYEAKPLFSQDQDIINFFKQSFCKVFKPEIEFFHYLHPEKLEGYQYWDEYHNNLKK